MIQEYPQQSLVERQPLGSLSEPWQPSAERCRVVFLTAGCLGISIPEIGRQTIDAQTWALLRDLGPKSSCVADATAEGFVLEVNMAHLESLGGAESNRPSRLECLFCPQRSAAFFTSGKIRARMCRGVTQLEAVAHPRGVIPICRQQAAAFELLAEVLEQVRRQEKSCCETACYSEHEREKFAAIARFLEEHPEENHSLAALCRRFFVNECKLKQGFKAVHGKTVFAYLREARMLEAERQLLEGRYTVATIANAVGYSNPSQFSRAFCNYHGCKPGQLLAASQ